MPSDDCGQMLKMRAAMGENGRKAVLECFDRDNIAKGFIQRLEARDGRMNPAEHPSGRGRCFTDAHGGSSREKRGVAESGSRSGSPSVLVVDPSCFSLPYDYSLCEALSNRGCAVTLVRSEFVHTPWQAATSFKVWNHFYSAATLASSRASGAWWKLGKLAEHTRDMARLVTECEKQKPDIIHFQWLPDPDDRSQIPAQPAAHCAAGLDIAQHHDVSWLACATASPGSWI